MEGHMVIYVTEIKQRKPNYFMTDEEVQILWRYAKRWGSKAQLLFAFAIFRGLRIGEVCAINILDFSADFSSLRVIHEKSHIEDRLPLIPQLSALARDYVLKNRHLMKDGFLFPFYSSRRHAPHLTTKVAEAIFSKLRKIIGKDYPAFLERNPFSKGFIRYRYRIGFHSCRRWFETRIYDNIKDRKRLADIMRYLDVATVDIYINPYETWQKERSILQGTFGDQFNALEMLSKGQRRLGEYGLL